MDNKGQGFFFFFFLWQLSMCQMDRGVISATYSAVNKDLTVLTINLTKSITMFFERWYGLIYISASLFLQEKLGQCLKCKLKTEWKEKKKEDDLQIL